MAGQEGGTSQEGKPVSIRMPGRRRSGRRHGVRLLTSAPQNHPAKISDARMRPRPTRAPSQSQELPRMGRHPTPDAGLPVFPSSPLPRRGPTCMSSPGISEHLALILAWFGVGKARRNDNKLTLTGRRGAHQFSKATKDLLE